MYSSVEKTDENMIGHFGQVAIMSDNTN